MGNTESAKAEPDDVFNDYLEHLKLNNQKKSSQRKIKEEKARYVNHDKWFRLFKNFEQSYLSCKDDLLSRDRRWHKSLKSCLPMPSTPGNPNIVQRHLCEVFQNADHPFCVLLLHFSNLFHATFGQSKGRTKRKKRRKRTRSSKKRTMVGPAQDFSALPRRRTTNNSYLQLEPRVVLKRAVKDINGFVTRFCDQLVAVFPRINSCRYYRDSTRNAVQESLFQFLQPTLFDLYKVVNEELDRTLSQNVYALENVTAEGFGIPEHLTLSHPPPSPARGPNPNPNPSAMSGRSPLPPSFAQSPNFNIGSFGGLSPPKIQPLHHPLSVASQEFEDITAETNLIISVSSPSVNGSAKGEGKSAKGEIGREAMSPLAYRMTPKTESAISPPAPVPTDAQPPHSNSKSTNSNNSNGSPTARNSRSAVSSRKSSNSHSPSSPFYSSSRRPSGYSSSPPISIYSGRTPPIPIQGSHLTTVLKQKRSYIDPPDDILRNAAEVPSEDLLHSVASSLAQSPRASLISRNFMSVSPQRGASPIAISRERKQHDNLSISGTRSSFSSCESVESLTTTSADAGKPSLHSSSAGSSSTNNNHLTVPIPIPNSNSLPASPKTPDLLLLSRSPSPSGGIFGNDDEHVKIYIPYEKALRELHKMPSQASPIGKIDAIIAMSDAVCSCIDEYHQRVDAKVDLNTVTRINADDLLSIFAYIIIKGKVPNLISETDFIDDFVAPNMKLSMPGYYLATLRAAVSLINQLDHDEILKKQNSNKK